ncbi:heavy-metal-associated domain-containing protein [Halonatronum saccharophilum]|uniref:heavy-metal-associated domain-containing protein n=1 Tax=Halonatronum saccharophilum TaxID=150060 RepID=UPI000487A616|nr:copper ion binding protein [Halonatronum saccharophilum]
MKKEEFEVQGMSCGHCKGAVEKALNSADGVKDAKVDLEAAKVKVEFDESKTDLDKLKNEVRAAGYEVS